MVAVQAGAKNFKDLSVTHNLNSPNISEVSAALLSARFSRLHFQVGNFMIKTAIDKLARTYTQSTADFIDTIVSSFREFHKGYFVSMFSWRLLLLIMTGARIPSLSLE